MERLIARLAVLICAASLQAHPTPEHRSRYTAEVVTYKWIVQEEWRWDELSRHYYIHLIPVLTPDYRGDWRHMPRGDELPRAKEGER